jgi:hypothetical protein
MAMAGCPSFSGLLEQRGNAGGTVEQRELGVDVEVGELQNF